MNVMEFKLLKLAYTKTAVQTCSRRQTKIDRRTRKVKVY